MCDVTKMETQPKLVADPNRDRINRREMRNFVDQNVCVGYAYPQLDKDGGFYGGEKLGIWLLGV